MSSFGTDDGIGDIIKGVGGGGGGRIEIETLKLTPTRPTSSNKYYK